MAEAIERANTGRLPPEPKWHRTEMLIRIDHGAEEPSGPPAHFVTADEAEDPEDLARKKPGPALSVVEEEACGAVRAALDQEIARRASPVPGIEAEHEARAAARAAEEKRYHVHERCRDFVMDQAKYRAPAISPSHADLERFKADARARLASGRSASDAELRASSPTKTGPSQEETAQDLTGQRRDNPGPISFAELEAFRRDMRYVKPKPLKETGDLAKAMDDAIEDARSHCPPGHEMVVDDTLVPASGEGGGTNLRVHYEPIVPVAEEPVANIAADSPKAPYRAPIPDHVRDVHEMASSLRLVLALTVVGALRNVRGYTTGVRWWTDFLPRIAIDHLSKMSGWEHVEKVERSAFDVVMLALSMALGRQHKPEEACARLLYEHSGKLAKRAEELILDGAFKHIHQVEFDIGIEFSAYAAMVAQALNATPEGV